MVNTFKRNIILGFGLAFFLLVISSAASYISIRNLLFSARQVDHTHQVIGRLQQVSSLILEAETNQRGFLITSEPSFLHPMQAELSLLRNKLSEIKTLAKDNPRQQIYIDRLSGQIEERLSVLNNTIRLKQENKPVPNEILMQGKEYMDSVKALISVMEGEERRLLAERTASVQKFSTYTPLLIIIAALISFVATWIAYSKVMSDYKRRTVLQDELIQKDVEISRRLRIIQGIAEKVAQGNYSIRVDDEGKDLLGTLAGSLNTMSESLQHSFDKLAEKEWLQSGIAGLNVQMLGEKDIEPLAESVLQFVAEYSGSEAGALYYMDDYSRKLMLISCFGLPPEITKEISEGAGVAGSCAAQKKIIVVDGLKEEHFRLNGSMGSIIPSSIVSIPIMYEGKVSGVIELGSVSGYRQREMSFFNNVCEQTGIAFNASHSRRKLQELLEETQTQAEELQMQHSELENMNEELKAQTQKLQVSEEELKVQQEELMQTNTELEERTTMLEEKNQMIEERNREIQQKAKDLELSTRYKSEFLANMSHELRTPLNSILLLSRLMIEDNRENLSDDQREYARVIQNSGQSLLTLIDEILDLSRIEAGKMQMEISPVHIKEITNDLHSLFAPVAAEKKLRFSINISSDVPDIIETDKMRLEQVLKNLLANALKFTSEGSVQLSVSNAYTKEAAISFSVKDTGIGIPADKQKLIFEAFQQADGSTRRQFGGTGLGLSISRELAKLLGGEITLDSTPGEGSEFRLTIPVRLQVPAEDPQPAVHEKRKNQPSVREDILVTQNDTPDKMSAVIQRIENVLNEEPKKVLIVEENPVHAKALSYFLENYNIEAELKNDVSEAKRYLSEIDKGCVILDTGIHDEDSYRALEEIKNTAGLEHLPIIVFTGKNLSPLQEGRLKQYVNSIVIKTAHSYQRILDEVQLFLRMSQDKKNGSGKAYRKLGSLTEVLKDKQVLIADDDVRNIFSLSKALENYGMNIISAIDGREAMEQLKKNPSVDIVLMDMMMPEMDGYETMTRIRSTPGFSKLPIIAVTAKAMAGDREKCIRSGASDYITKPIDKDQLLSLLRVWLYDRN